MRIWLDPNKVSEMGMSAMEVVDALRAQNVQVAGGVLAQPPAPSGRAFQPSITVQGRFRQPEEFENLIIRNTDGGRVVRLRDVGRAELGARNYGTNAYINDSAAVALLVFQRPGTNALQGSETIQATVAAPERDRPSGVEFRMTYNPTEFFVRTSIKALEVTIYEAIALVVLVVIVFLQNVRATVIPLRAIPVSIVGTFAAMAMLGYTINTLTLFALVLAVGIVVDDAIVVVENVERYIVEGLSPKDAARKTMDEVGGALISIALVLTSVFVPTMFIVGISGEFFRQFAVVISVATLISAFNSLSLSPALAGLLLKPHHPHTGGKATVFARLLRSGEVRGVDPGRSEQTRRRHHRRADHRHRPTDHPGIGASGGFSLRVQDLNNNGPVALARATDDLLAALKADPRILLAFTPFSTNAPQFFVDVDRTKAEMLSMPVQNVHSTLEAYLGSAYVNDFNLSGRTYQVIAQAEGLSRLDVEQIGRLKARSDTGAMVPLDSVASFSTQSAPDRVPRYNLFPTAEIIGSAVPAVSSDAALTLVDEIAARTLPEGFAIEWTELSYQQRLAGGGIVTFLLSVVFVYLVLASQYESWTLPLAVVLIVPM